jgi:hypothetical protein
VTFYTYLWLREDGTPYYVGKATRQRRAYRVSCPPQDRIVIQEWLTETDALEAEKSLIAHYGRKDLGTGILRNLTDGGEGTSGHKQSPEAIEKRVSKIRGMKRPEWVRKLLSAGKLGEKNPSYKVRGEQHWNRGLVRSEDTKQKIREKRVLQDMSSRIKAFCKRGHPRTAETVSANSTCLLCKKLLRPKAGAWLL